MKRLLILLTAAISLNLSAQSRAAYERVGKKMVFDAIENANAKNYETAYLQARRAKDFLSNVPYQCTSDPSIVLESCGAAHRPPDGQDASLLSELGTGRRHVRPRQRLRRQGLVGLGQETAPAAPAVIGTKSTRP